MLGEDLFVGTLPTQNVPYGTTVRSFLQRFLQNTGGEEIFLHKGPHTSANVDLVAGDFWLNVYADSLNVGADLLTGTGLSRYVALQKIVAAAEAKKGQAFDFVIIDLPPSFGALVRAAFYSSHYYVVPCTSDKFQRVLRWSDRSNGTVLYRGLGNRPQALQGHESTFHRL